MKKSQFIKPAIYISIIGLVLFSIAYFAFVYQEIQYNLLGKGVKDADIVFYGQNNFEPFANNSKENPVILVPSKGYNVVIPKIGLNKPLSQLNKIENYSEDLSKNSANTLFHFSSMENDSISGVIVLNNKYKYFDFTSENENLLIYKAKKGDFVYVTRDNELFKYQITKRGYNYKQPSFDNTKLVIVATGPIDISIPYYLEAELID